jgi:hypothetical protein
VRSPVGRELFLLLCVGLCERQSNGKILLDHYRHKRRRSAGDERVCHQPVTAMRLPTARPKSAGCGTGPPARLSFPISARSTCVAPTRRSQDLTLTRSAQRTTVKGRCRRERSETALRVVPRSLKRQAPAPLGGKDAPKPDKVNRVSSDTIAQFSRPRIVPSRTSLRPRKTWYESSRTMRCRGSVVWASLSQAGIPRVRNGAQTNGAQTPPTELRTAAMPADTMVNEAAGGTIEWSWHPLLAPRRRTSSSPTRLSINH